MQRYLIWGTAFDFAFPQDEVHVVGDLLVHNDCSVGLVAAAELVQSVEQLDDKVDCPVGDVGVDHVEEDGRLSNDVE